MYLTYSRVDACPRGEGEVRKMRTHPPYLY